MLVEVGALISWYIYSYRIVTLLVPYMWASMTFLPTKGHSKVFLHDLLHFSF